MSAMKSKGLTISMVFDAESANYGEGFGNISTLKRISRDGGKTYSYISRQALRYSIVSQLGWDDTKVIEQGSGQNKVVQFSPDVTIRDSAEIDLFGYMKTVKDENAKTRSAVARLSNAVSLEPFQMDVDFLTNMGLAKRENFNNAIAQIELHRSYYAYTLTVDLDRIGIDGEIEIPVSERAQRVTALLDAVEHLYRDIKGRRENLSPIFVAGGVYERKTPFFENRIKVSRGFLNTETLLQTAEIAGRSTRFGYLRGSFLNDSDVEEQLRPTTIPAFFDDLRTEVKEAYGESN